MYIIMHEFKSSQSTSIHAAIECIVNCKITKAFQ